MTFEKRIAAKFQMDEETRLRHANPWSVYTRFTVVPLMALSVRSRVRVGDWWILLFGGVIVWTRYNPRIFAKPASYNTWAGKGVFGERIRLHRDKKPVASYHYRPIRLLNLIQVSGLVLMIVWLTILHWWLTIIWIILIYTKVRFVDRMVRIFEEMKDEYPELRELVYKL